jgi:hypothetical protein
MSKERSGRDGLADFLCLETPGTGWYSNEHLQPNGCCSSNSDTLNAEERQILLRTKKVAHFSVAGVATRVFIGPRTLFGAVTQPLHVLQEQPWHPTARPHPRARRISARGSDAAKRLEIVRLTRSKTHTEKHPLIPFERLTP